MTAQSFSFSHPMKESLEHQLSIQGDLGRADDALSSLLDRSALFGGGGLLAEAMFTLAVVAYVRCFASGRRKGLSPDIFGGKPRLRRAHDEFKSIRDQHIAHAVGVLENLHVMVAADDPSSPALGVGALGVFFSHTSKRSTLLLLRQVVRHARSHVGKEIDSLGSALASELMGRTTSWKDSQNSFRAAIGDEGFTRGSSGIEARMMKRAPKLASR